VLVHVASLVHHLAGLDENHVRLNVDGLLVLELVLFAAYDNFNGTGGSVSQEPGLLGETWTTERFGAETIYTERS